MISPQKTNASMGNTMYNLTNKRTLPREVIKWMQGLDLSYSVKDYRKDMTNGFLIAEIISRYEPGRIPMHAFENSQNAARRDNNWNQLNLFFKKHTIRDVQIGPEQYTSVMKSTDPRSQQLHQLICRLYTVCTKRTLSQNAPIVDLPPTQTNNPNLTASYLLKQEGLQKLETSNVAGSGLKPKVPEPGKTEEKDKSQDRVPTRKIGSSLDGNSNMVDVMGIGIKADNRKGTSKRKSWEAKQQSNYSEDNPDNQKLIFDYFSEIIEECLPASDEALREQLIPQNAKFSPTEALRKALPSIDRQFFCNFLNQIVLNMTSLVPIILREINQTWKFFTYFLKMVRHYSFDSQQFTLLYQIIQSYAIAARNREIKRIQKVFIDSIINSIIGEVRVSRQWKKKEKLMALVYDFQGREIFDKKAVLSKLKESLGSNNSIYMQWLSVLVRQETETRNNLGNKLIEDYIYYAHQYLGSSVNILRTAALKIFYQVSKTQSHELLQSFFQSRALAFQNSSCDPEQVLLLALIYCNLLKQVITSKEYQTLIKGNNASSLVKVYNPDNQKNLDDLRKKTHLLGETVHRLFNCTSDVTVRQICARISVPLLPESQPLMQVFLQFISGVEEKEDFIKAGQSEYQLKSFKLICSSVQIGIIEQYSNEILVQIIALMLRQGVGVEKNLFLINYSLKHLNVKKVNMEIWEDISLHIAKPYTQLLTNQSYCRQAFEGIKNICLIHFNFDMKIREFPGWLAKAIIDISAAGKSPCLNEVKLFNDFVNAEYAKGKHDSIRFMVQELTENLQAKGVYNLIALQEAF